MLKLSSDDVYNWFRKRKIKSFFTDINAPSFRIGANCLMQVRTEPDFKIKKG